MRTRLFKYLFLTFYMFCGCFGAFSQQQPDSLMQYLAIAAKNNPTVLQKYNEYLAALQKVPQVGSLPDPELSLGVFLQPMELVSGNQVADIRLMQMFPWFGVLKNAKDEMSLMAKAKYELLRDAKLQVFYDVQVSWYELLNNNQNTRIAEKNLEILHSIERLTLVKFKAVSTGSSNSSTNETINENTTQNNNSGLTGMNSMGGNSGNLQSNNSQSSMGNRSSNMGISSGGSGLVDVYRVQIEIGELENNIALLKSRQKTLMAKFNSYLNRPLTSFVSLPDTIKPDLPNVSLLHVTDSLLTNNPMLGMLQYEGQSLDARKKMVSRMRYPMVGVGVNYSVISKSAMSTSSMNGTDMIMPMLTVTLPVYQKKYKAMQKEADLLKSANEQGYKAISNSLQTEYYEALQSYQDAERRMTLYADQSQLVKKSFDIMIKSFSVSGTGLTDLLRIRQQLLDYETKQIEAITDYNTSIAWLKRLMASTQIQ